METNAVTALIKCLFVHSQKFTKQPATCTCTYNHFLSSEIKTCTQQSLTLLLIMHPIRKNILMSLFWIHSTKLLTVRYNENSVNNFTKIVIVGNSFNWRLLPRAFKGWTQIPPSRSMNYKQHIVILPHTLPTSTNKQLWRRCLGW